MIKKTKLTMRVLYNKSHINNNNNKMAKFLSIMHKLYINTFPISYLSIIYKKKDLL